MMAGFWHESLFSSGHSAKSAFYIGIFEAFNQIMKKPGSFFFFSIS